MRGKRGASAAGLNKPPVGGLILAGGRSSRFGREKALAMLDGDPLIAWVLRVLARGCGQVAVSAPAGSAAAGFAAAQALPCLADAPGDADGPLAGVRAGLEWARSMGFAGLVTAPCDTPFLPVDMVERLCAGGREAGAMACTAEGCQPLCAVWPPAAYEVMQDLDGHPSIRAVLERIGAAEVRFDDVDAFANLNTPQDYAWAETVRSHAGAAAR